MKPRERLTIDAFWLALILLVGSMQYWFPNLRPGGLHNRVGLGGFLGQAGGTGHND